MLVLSFPLHSNANENTSENIAVSEKDEVQQVAVKDAANDKASEMSRIDKLLDYFGSSESVDVSDGIDWGVLPGPFSNPEQGFGIGVAIIGLYAPQGLDTGNQLSTVTISAYGSTEGSFGVGINNSTFLNKNLIKLGLDASISHSPVNYWGIGKEAAEDDRQKTKHTSLFIDLEPTVSYQFMPNYFIKVGLNTSFLLNQDAEGIALNDKELENKTNFGTVIALEYDSRDYERNPYSGRYLSLTQRSYFDGLGGDYDYQKFTFNYREYLKLFDRNVLAWDFFWEGLSDDKELPWFAVSKLGSDKRMRGYYEGQYRDRYQMAAQLEYRHQFTERHGMTVWGGGGNVAKHSHLLFEGSWLPTYGIGYRFAFKPRVNVRLDLAFGDDDSVFYFNVYEAF